MSDRAKVRGCLLAGACGDALGYPVEFLSGAAIRQRFGAEGVREMELTGGVARISDDTQMTLFTAEGMLTALSHDGDPTDCVYQAYLGWLHTQYPSFQPGRFSGESRLLTCDVLYWRRAPGNTCLSALTSGRMGTPDEPLNQSKGCGGVMRTAPAGMLRLMTSDDPEDAYAMQGAAFAAISHGHPLGWLSAAMQADLTRQCLGEARASWGERVERAIARLEKIWPECGWVADLAELTRRAICLAGEDLPDEQAIRKLGEGWVGDEALAIALYCCAKHPDSVEECLSAAVSHGGDSDSTGAVAGSLIGADLGEQAIPARWLRKLEAREIIEAMADALAEAGA